MSNSRNSQKHKNSQQVNSSDDSAPDSPAIKVKYRENKTNQDPLYYHPSAHPVLSTFFKRKSEELDKKLNVSAEALPKEDVSLENSSGTKATL